jgi:hypothetical protein
VPDSCNPPVFVLYLIPEPVPINGLRKKKGDSEQGPKPLKKGLKLTILTISVKRCHTEKQTVDKFEGIWPKFAPQK